MSLLQLKQLTVRFQGLVAVNEVSLSVAEGQIHSVIGPNGAGKTTVFNAITGIYDPSEGEVLFCGAKTERSRTTRTLLGFGTWGLVLGFAMVVAVNVQGLWDATISQNYRYQQGFPWGKAFADYWRFLGSLSFTWGVVPALIGCVVGAGGAYSVWKQSSRRPDFLSQLGLARTFQNIRLFRNLTAIENVLVGMDSAFTYSAWHAALRLPRFYRNERERRAEAAKLLAFVEFEAEADMLAGQLSYGHQRRLEIARALASSPKLLLLDEPAAGMNPTEAHELVELIRKIRETGVSVLLIEHHMKVVMAISDQITVLDFGNKIAEGTADVVCKDPRVIEAYLGPQV